MTKKEIMIIAFVLLMFGGGVALALYLNDKSAKAATTKAVSVTSNNLAMTDGNGNLTEHGQIEMINYLYS